jgi:hypothetical protein
MTDSRISSGRYSLFMSRAAVTPARFILVVVVVSVLGIAVGALGAADLL